MKKKIISAQEPTLVEDVTYKYVPYWPLFVLLIIPCFILAWAYLKVRTPVYEITARMQVKDEKKGVENDQITESISFLSAKSIVENEVEVIHSKKFAEEIVRDLSLYAPTYLKTRVKTTSAYLTSPIVIEALDPYAINTKEPKKIAFSYDFNKKAVTIEDKQYPIDRFVNTAYGTLKFKQNPNFKKSEQGQLSFELVNPKGVASAVYAGMDVSAVGKTSSIVDIKYKDEVPKRGEDIVNLLMEKYKAATLEAKTELAKNTIAFLDTRIARVVEDLNALEGKIQKFRSNKNVVNLTDQSRLYLQNVAMNDQKIADINSQLSVLGQVEQYVTANQNTPGVVPTALGVNDVQLSKMLEKLYETELNYERLKQTTPENNPTMQTLASQIQTLRPAVVENIKNQRINLEATKSNLSLTNNSYNSMLGTVPAKERELVDVSRDQAIKNNLYNFLLQKREQAALSYSSAVIESQVIDKAQSSVRPVSPNKPFTYLMALGLALIGTVGFAMIRDVLPGTILFRNQVEKFTALPILGEIPYLKRAREILTTKDNAAIADQYRQLITAAGLFNKNNTRRRILITSSRNGEGKTFTSTNIAVSLANAGKRVALIDMNLRNSDLSKAFNVENIPGVTDFLSGDATLESIVKQTEYKNLWLVPVGEANSNPTGLLLNGQLEKLLEALEQQFDFVIMDSAPTHPASDPYILSQVSDLTLYIVRHRWTPAEYIKKLDENIELKPLKNLAIVFNGVKPRGFVVKSKSFSYGVEVK